MTTAAGAAGNVRLRLVEDNEHDATLIIEQLRRDGFRLEWHSRRRSRHHPFRLRVPSFDVATALRLLHERKLDLSDYADETIVKRGALKPGTPFMQKPFTATALATKVRELLDAGPSQP